MSLEEKKYNPAYLKGLSSSEKAKRKKELERGERSDTEDPSAYEPSRFKTDFTKGGERKETKPSKWTKEYNKKFKKGLGESIDEDYGGNLELDESIDLDLDGLIREFVEQMVLIEKKKRNNVTKALRNKSEESGAPVKALRAIYNKGLAAWRTGHRPGASQHAWAMARVNSVLAGGPARKVDADEWQQIKKHRGKKRKKK